MRSVFWLFACCEKIVRECRRYTKTHIFERGAQELENREAPKSLKIRSGCI
jgi:hypothetical protein